MPQSQPIAPTPGDTGESALYEAACRLVEASSQEYDVDAGGSHHLIRVCAPVEAWLRFMKAVRIEGDWLLSNEGGRS